MQRILVVDDNTEICDVLHDFLTWKGYEVYQACDSANALQQVQEVRPHIILLDVVMPGMDGIATLQEIKKIAPSVGIIMLTAVIDEPLAKSAMALGAYDYITKPINLEYLEIVVMTRIAIS
jgi:DNA-binding response OmpR family regulator